MRHRLVAAEGGREGKKRKNPAHMLAISEEAAADPDTGQTIPKAFLLHSQMKLKQLYSGCKWKKKGEVHEWVRSRKGRSPAAHQGVRRRPPHPACPHGATHTHRCRQASSSFCSAVFLSLFFFSLPLRGSEPDIPAGPVSLKWLVGASSCYRGRDWRKPICLAEENGPGPGVNQQTQYTAHSVHTGTHTYAHTGKCKHCPLCPHSAAVTRPARFGG